MIDDKRHTVGNADLKSNRLQRVFPASRFGVNRRNGGNAWGIKQNKGHKGNRGSRGKDLGQHRRQLRNVADVIHHGHRGHNAFLRDQPGDQSDCRLPVAKTQRDEQRGVGSSTICNAKLKLVSTHSSTVMEKMIVPALIKKPLAFCHMWFIVT